MINLNCKNCDKKIQKRPSEVKKSKSGNFFCSCSCAASFNNKKFPKQELKEWRCLKCNGIIKRHSHKNRKKYHDACRLILDDHTTLGEMTRRNVKNPLALIRASSRAKYLEQLSEHYCERCGYDKHIHVCHIKPLTEFSSVNTIGEINDLSNLVALCPNCHWELDNGFFKYE